MNRRTGEGGARSHPRPPARRPPAPTRPAFCPPRSGELFGVCPVPRGQRNLAVESASDSSRNFVLRLEDAATKRHAFVGLRCERGVARRVPQAGPPSSPPRSLLVLQLCRPLCSV